MRVLLLVVVAFAALEPAFCARSALEERTVACSVAERPTGAFRSAPSRTPTARRAPNVASIATNGSSSVPGVLEKELLVRDDDVQVLHKFNPSEQARAYLKIDLFNADVVTALKPLLDAAPDVRIYQIA
jgi:hypothetical protein